MKRKKFVYDYCPRHQHGKFVCWEVHKVRQAAILEPTPTVALFYGKKAKTHAKEFSKKLNQDLLA